MLRIHAWLLGSMYTCLVVGIDGDTVEYMFSMVGIMWSHVRTRVSRDGYVVDVHNWAGGMLGCIQMVLSAHSSGRSVVRLVDRCIWNEHCQLPTNGRK
ncbi:hypothetical protein GE09DRAFT_1127532 [Coniochaeta sp. 2T2.1]|nr:hypothetical protein GE09DRAFT_1127532 [Coniochaeta sp. 2T2.1]